MISPGESSLSTRDVVPADIEWVAMALGKWQCTDRWSSVWGRTPSPPLLSHLLWGDIALQEVVWDADDAVGLFQLAGANLEHGFAYLELLVDPERLADADMPLSRFVRRAFDNFPLRKLCLAAGDDDLVVPQCLAKTAERIGCLQAHRRRGRDSYADVGLYEIWVEAWS